MKKILVTGATGFIGNYVVEELLRRGHHVIATSSKKENAVAKNWFRKVIYKPFDFSNFDSTVNYVEYFNHPDLLIHLAWKGLPNYKSDFHVKENLPNDIRFLKSLMDNGLKDITVTGTCLEYGMKEGCLSENMESEPTIPYSVAKNELRKFLENYAFVNHVSFKWVRLFYIYGKGQNRNSLLSQLENAILKKEKVFNMSEGDQVRDYLSVELAAQYIVKIALQKKTTGIINCCSGKPVKIIDLVESYIRETETEIELNKGFYPYPDYEPKVFWGNNLKLKKIINDK